jgi:hypothetical protein
MNQHEPAKLPLWEEIGRLLSLHDGDRGVLEVVARGPSAIPALRQCLFEREPSGLYEPRRRVVEALAALGCEDILLTFLESNRVFPDPVENAGEEAVLNAAARALRQPCAERASAILLSLATRRRLPGAIQTLARCHDRAALPCFIEALADDIARPAAEDAIRQLGTGATAALVQALRTDDQGESNRRRMGAALNLLLDLGAAGEIPSAVRRRLMQSDDPAIAVSGCRAALRHGGEPERRDAVSRLVALLSFPRWHVRLEAEACLLAHAASVRLLIDGDTLPPLPPLDDLSPRAEGLRARHRIMARLAARSCGD